MPRVHTQAAVRTRQRGPAVMGQNVAATFSQISLPAADNSPRRSQDLPDPLGIPLRPSQPVTSLITSHGGLGDWRFSRCPG